MLPRINAVNNNVTSDRLNSDRVTNIPSIEPEDRVILSQEALRNEGMMPATERVVSDKPRVQAILDRIYERDENLTHLKVGEYSLEVGGYSLEFVSEDIVLIAKALQSNPHITSLDVSNQNIGVEGAKALATIQTLRRLDVSSNNIGAEGAKALAKNKTLERLYVSNNIIGLDQERLLEDRISQNRERMEALSLSVVNTPISDEENPLAGTKLTSKDYLNAKQYQEALVSYMLHKASENPQYASQLKNRFGDNADANRAALTDKLRLTVLDRDASFLEATGIARNDHMHRSTAESDILISKDIAAIIGSFLKPSDILKPADINRGTRPTPAAQSKNDRGR
ncbi:MAG: hypothetical protein V4485_01785 [Pseudomonadota bacterium]